MATQRTNKADAARLLADAESRYDDLVRISDRAIMVVQGGQIAVANDALVGLVGATRPEQVVGQPAGRFFGTGLETGPGAPRHRQVDAALDRLDSTQVPVSLDLIACRYQAADALQVFVRDAGERKRLEGRLQFLVRHDQLTELPNRTEFRDRLVGAVARARRASRLLAVMLINLDRFKTVNAAHGSEGGDLLLQEAGRRIVASVRQSDSVGRIAGDEFGVLLEGLEQREQAAIVANRVLASLRLPADVGGAQVTITASAGIAAYPVDAPDIDAVLRMADMAMYAAKEGGGNGFRFYFAELEAMSNRDDARRAQTAKKLEKLTAREREVMEVLIEGNSNKAIAYLLGASPRTIENHRAKVMEKMEADSLPDLVRMVLEMQQAPK